MSMRYKIKSEVTALISVQFRDSESRLGSLYHEFSVLTKYCIKNSVSRNYSDFSPQMKKNKNEKR